MLRPTTIGSFRTAINFTEQATEILWFATLGLGDELEKRMIAKGSIIIEAGTI
jgi:hypothetical protein